jgi:hypothetical protein
MRRAGLLSLIILTSCLSTGCRSCFLLNPYANLVDDINDTHVYFDHWYNPRLDISRAGRPDWCGPINSRLGRNICYMGCYDRYDDENLYPPSHPYSFPSHTMPAPTYWTKGSPDPEPPTPPLPPGPTPANSDDI